MPQHNVQPFVLRDVLLRLPLEGVDNDFEKHVSSVTFTPTSSTVSWQGLTPDAKFTGVTAADWTCAIEFAQDWESATSLSRFLYEHEGETIDGARFEPVRGGTGFEADLTLTPGAIGGAVNTVGTGSVTLGSTRPALVPPAVPAG